MRELVYTLVGDGPSDRRLIFPTNWLLAIHSPMPFRAQWADTRAFVRLREGLGPRIEKALELFPCDILIVHRDAEAADHRPRRNEIDEALSGLDVPPHVKLVPVRMQEAWFLLDEPAIRRAAGKPTGRSALAIPRPERIEEIADPKALLHEQLRIASEKSGRHLRRLDLHAASTRVAELTVDYSGLRRVPAFQRFEADLADAVRRIVNV